MKKITDLKEGELLSIEAAARLFGVTKKTLYHWHAKALLYPDKFPRGAKIGRHVFFLKSDLIDRINRQFNQPS